jgi:hypothetical protein
MNGGTTGLEPAASAVTESGNYLKLDGVGRLGLELQGTLSNCYCPLIVPRFQLVKSSTAGLSVLVLCLHALFILG